MLRERKSLEEKSVEVSGMRVRRRRDCLDLRRWRAARREVRREGGDFEESIGYVCMCMCM